MVQRHAPTEAPSKIRRSKAEKLTMIGAGAAVLLGAAACSNGEINHTVAAETSGATLVETPDTEMESSQTLEDICAQPNVSPADIMEFMDSDYLTTIPSSFAELGDYNCYDIATQTRIKELESMPLDVFQTLPSEEQLTYALHLIKNIMPIVEHRLSLNNINYIPYNQTAATPEEIIRNNELVVAALTAFRFERGDTMGYDNETAKKAATLLYGNESLSPSSEGIKKTYEIDWIDSIGSGASIDQAYLNEDVYSSTVNPDGTIAISVHTNTNGTDFYSIITFREIDVIGYDGSTSSVFVEIDRREDTARQQA